MLLRLLAASFTILFFTGNSFSQSGMLDKTFGNKGIVATGLKLYSDEHYMFADKMIQLPDDKVLVAASTKYGSTHAYLSKYFNDGSIDSSFGNNGRLSIYSGKNDFEIDALAADQAGRILFTANLYSSSVFSKSILVRLTPNGSYDSSFAGTGII